MTRHVPRAPRVPLDSPVRTAKMNEPWPRARDRRLRIAELFVSLQGEGTRAGLPTTFLRLTGCALRCAWCDSEWAFYEGHWERLAALAERIESLGVDRVCVTGGEPLLQPSVVPLMRRLCEDVGKEVIVETSGDQDISCLPERVVRIMDIKLPGSGMQARNNWNNLRYLTERDEVKFVIADRDDYECARETVASKLAGFCGEVLFSGVHDSLPSARLAEWVLEDRLPVRLQTQLHKQLWPGRERGI